LITAKSCLGVDGLLENAKEYLSGNENKPKKIRLRRLSERVDRFCGGHISPILKLTTAANLGVTGRKEAEAHRTQAVTRLERR
jgi:hypothetical protein